MDGNDKSRVGAVILAAGTSSRMGETKQLLSWGGNTVLGQVLENVRSAGMHEIVLVLGFAADTVQQQLAGESLGGSLKVVVNHAYREGMAGSLRKGLAALEPETAAALVVLADQPLVLPSTMELIAGEYRLGAARIVVPIFKGHRGNPVLLDRSLFPEAKALRGEMGCRALFGNHLEEIVTLPVDDAGILLDADSKDDYERLRRIIELRSGELRSGELRSGESRTSKSRTSEAKGDEAALIEEGIRLRNRRPPRIGE